jgi:NAD(P)-dependent dehydrogenase (short-subunit alcohol dehydrogenase family)
MSGTAIITGGTGGLGAAVTRAFLQAGWRVVVPWYAESELTRLELHPRLVLVQADLADPASVAAVVVEAASAPDDPLDAVVNLVGGYSAGGLIHETDVAEFEAQLTLNLRPTYLTSHFALPHLIARGHGSIVCVSSRAALRPFAGAAGYITGKAAVLTLVDTLAAEYTSMGIRANAVLPSVIDTPGNRASQPDADHSRWVAPEQIADAILFLCSDAAAAISGGHVPVYGRA